MRTLLFFSILFVAFSPLSTSLAHADWTLEDILLSSTVEDFQPSPDGRWVVWVKGIPDMEEGKHIAHLFRTDLTTGREVRLTRGPDDCTQPRWSPDGTLLAFLSKRPGADSGKRKKSKKTAEEEDEATQQLWLMNNAGGEPWPVTDLPRDVSDFAWAGNGALVFLSGELPSHRESQRKQDKDDARIIEERTSTPPVRLWRVQVKSRKITRLTHNQDWMEKLAVSTDGQYALTAHKRSLRYTYDNKIKPVYILHNLRTGKKQQVLKNPRFNITHFSWDPAGTGFYVVNEHNTQPQYSEAGIPELHFLDIKTNKVTPIHLDWERGLAPQVHNDWRPGYAVFNGGFVALLANGVRPRAARFQRTAAGWKRTWLTGKHVKNLFGIQVTCDGKRLLYATSTASTPTQWYHGQLAADAIQKPQKLATINSHLQDLPCAHTEVVRWKGGQNEQVEGILYYPHAYKKGSKYPLIVMIHGGPASADFDSWEESWAYPANLYCERGAFVLKPNYHGSTQYGLKWLESITRGKYAGPELVDIEKGVDALIAQGLVDENKLGVMGWSNGAILTNHLVTRTTRFKAASAGAGNIEYVSDWANCEFGEAFNRFYLGKSPLQEPTLYHRKSPFYRLAQVRTPTLIIFGADDRVVPTQQGWVHYRGLQQLGKAPVRFMIFPNEEHSLKKLPHRRRKLKEELAWFDRYLFGTADKVSASLKYNSPLRWALALRKAARVGHRYGLVRGKVLIPEIVTYDGMDVARFEITRAQFQSFDPRYPVPPGQENFPASGISYDRAKAYCTWLSRLTGQTYRLPTHIESNTLYDSPANQENTLDYWASYAPNPDDAARLRKEIKKLGQGGLLKAVGSFAGVGDEALVFDLGGNVAEWVKDRKGKGVLRGGSADRVANPKEKRRQPTSAYWGFRVLREETK